jgi:hypothetical protein
MGTRSNTRNTQKIDCRTCGHKYSPMCDYRQGRCPHHPAMISVKVVQTRIQNLINFFKGK